MQVPGAPSQLEKPQAPPIPPVYIAMAAAQMHAEGRWPQPKSNELESAKQSLGYMLKQPEAKTLIETDQMISRGISDEVRGRSGGSLKSDVGE